MQARLEQARHEQSQETINALNEQRLELFELQLKATQELVKELRDERDRAMKWGIMALGTAVIGMGLWIFNLVAGHLK